jgi:hypothetical protein
MLLVHLLFFIGVAKDDDLAITERLKDNTIEVAKKLPSELLIPRGIRMRPSSSEDEDRSTTGAFSEGPPCSCTDEQWRCEKTSGGDLIGGGDPEDVDGGTLLGDGLPSEGERERLVSLLSSIVPK